MKNVNKTLAVGLLISWAGFCPQRAGHSQPPIPAVTAPEVDSLEELQAQAKEDQERKRKADSAALSISRELPALVNKLERSVAARKENKTNGRNSKSEGCDKIPLLNYNGETYEVGYDSYKGYLIIDLDSFLSNTASLKDTSIYIHCNHLPETKPEPSGIKKGWHKIKQFISKPFRKKL